MNDEANIPNLMHVRVMSEGGPFAAGHILSVAFSTPTVARLLPHATNDESSQHDLAPRLVPESISARVIAEAPPYSVGDVVMLSFVDPRFARIHRAHGASDVEALGEPRFPVADDVANTTPINALTAIEPRSRSETPHGVRVRLGWQTERARRFVHVVDKLFTVDRLGWYRHVLAMRLLVPDEIDCGNEAGTAAASARLALVRAATIETLGRPLLAAFMPNFTVTTEWLETIDTPSVARALADLRDAVLPFADDEARLEPGDLSDSASVGILARTHLVGAPAGSSDAFLPALVPTRSASAALGEHLEAYRSALADVFAQTTHSVDAVRLGRMSEPNHVLDDRLWQLVGAIGSAFGGLAVA